MNEIIRSKWARAYCNGNILYLETVSGYRGGTHSDPQGKKYFFKEKEVSDDLLGTSLIEVLNLSRWVLASPRPGTTYPAGVEFDIDLYSQEQMSKRYAAWIKMLMDHYGYANKQKLFKNMANCYISIKDDVVTIIPSRHEKLEVWQGFSLNNPDIIKIRADSSSAQLGEALRLAFARCTD